MVYYGANPFAKLKKKIKAAKKNPKLKKKIIGMTIANIATGGAAGRLKAIQLAAKKAKKTKTGRKILKTAAAVGLAPLAALVPGAKTAAAAIALRKLAAKRAAQKKAVQKKLVSAPVQPDYDQPEQNEPTEYNPTTEAVQEEIDQGSSSPSMTIPQSQEMEQDQSEEVENGSEPEKKKMNPLIALGALAIPFLLG